jgi:DNA polymerase I-like protein with 3'-5' exonuclease and polymerase domains
MVINTAKEFVLQRIYTFASQVFDPNSDSQVVGILKSKFNIRLPQRRSINESLSSSVSDHEIISLILKYRSMG